MRNPNRLLLLYGHLIDMHRLNFPDWRFGQLIVNFESWMKTHKGIPDIFYVEDDKIIDYLNEYKESFIKK